MPSSVVARSVVCGPAFVSGLRSNFGANLRLCAIYSVLAGVCVWCTVCWPAYVCGVQCAGRRVCAVYSVLTSVCVCGVQCAHQSRLFKHVHGEHGGKISCQSPQRQ